MRKIGQMVAMASILLMPDVNIGGGTPAESPAPEGGEAEAPKVKVGNVALNNGINLDIFEHEQTRGAGKGTKFLGPDFDTVTTEMLVAGIDGEKLMDNFIRPNLRRACASFSRAAIKAANGDAKVLIEKFVGFFKDLSAKSDSIRALVMRQGELLKELRTIDATKDLQKFIEVANKLKQISGQIQDLREVPDDDDDNETPSIENAQKAA